MPFMGTLTVRIPEDLLRQVRRYCRQHKTTASKVVRDSLRRFLAIQELEAIQRKLAPLAKAKGIRTEEDIFRIIS